MPWTNAVTPPSVALSTASGVSPWGICMGICMSELNVVPAKNSLIIWCALLNCGVVPECAPFGALCRLWRTHKCLPRVVGLHWVTNAWLCCWKRFRQAPWQTVGHVRISKLLDRHSQSRSTIKMHKCTQRINVPNRCFATQLVCCYCGLQFAAN